MVDFRKYMHVERFGNDEVQGIELGTCYIFPKLDGTNGSTWLINGTDYYLGAGSRRRFLTLEADNAGFFAFVNDNPNLNSFHTKYRDLRTYGEWLVPHTLKTYNKDAWRKYYIFDVWHDVEERYLSYEEYQPLLDEFELDYIPPITIIKNATYDNLLVELNNNTFLINDGEGIGEGIVIKNYQFINKYHRVTWAKIVANFFKTDAAKTMGAPCKEMKVMTEQRFIDDYCTPELIAKTYAKIVNEKEGWNSKYIPMLFGMVYHDLVVEEVWSAIKKYKNPTINFRTVNNLMIMKIKEVKPELF
jgi:hypothetical protein